MESLFSQPQHEFHIRGIRGIFEDDDDEAAESSIREPVEKNRWSSIMIMESAEPSQPELREWLHLPPKPYADAAAEDLDAQGNTDTAPGSSAGEGGKERSGSSGVVEAQGTRNTSRGGYGNSTQSLNGTMQEDASTDIGNENIGDVPYNGVVEDEDDDESHHRGHRNGRMTATNRGRDERNGRKVARREKLKAGEEKAPLVGGRRAGAGWSRSG